VATVALVVAGCATHHLAASSTTGTPLTTSPTAAGSTSSTVWLCRPGATPDPCASSQVASSEAADGTLTPVPTLPAVPNASSFDCFYVYPTVSTQTTANANLTIETNERGVAIAQASRFSQDCRVWAPMYRQRTSHDLVTAGLGGDATAQQIAYSSLDAAWHDYLAHDNDGRPIVFIGHSQGAAILIHLLASEVDTNPSLRARMVSAIILGGNVEVPPGKEVGGSFAHIPACTSTGQTGCVIAYSSFANRPPKASLFGRPGQGVSLQSAQTATTGRSVVCTNPAALAGGTAPLQPYFATIGLKVEGKLVPTPWITYPGLYDATCMQAGGATWLQISATPARGDVRPVVRATLGPNWGLHLDDANIALGDLVADVAAQERAFHH
jgi:hypothetical protein